MNDKTNDSLKTILDEYAGAYHPENKDRMRLEALIQAERIKAKQEVLYATIQALARIMREHMLAELDTPKGGDK
jgi:hypothetical protein